MMYSALIACYERKWITHPPDLEGERGYLLFQGKLYYWTYFFDEESPQIESIYEIAEFIDLFRHSENPYIQNMLRELITKNK